MHEHFDYNLQSNQQSHPNTFNVLPLLSLDDYINDKIKMKSLQDLLMLPCNDWGSFLLKTCI